MARQLTIRNVPDDVAKRLERLSRERDESLNTTVVRILTEVVGVDARRTRLERYATWSADDVSAFNDALGTSTESSMPTSGVERLVLDTSAYSHFRGGHVAGAGRPGPRGTRARSR